MKKTCFFKTIILLSFVLFWAGNGLMAQNENFLSFDGGNDYVEYTDGNSLGMMDGATNYTFEAWIYPQESTISDYDYILIREFTIRMEIWKVNGTANTCDWWFSISPSGTGGSWTNYNTAGDATLNMDEWNHIAVIRNNTAGTLKLYVNGSDVSDGSNPDAIDLPASVNNDDLLIGAKNSSDNEFGGFIDEVRFKNVAEDIGDLHTSIYDNEYEADGNTACLFHFNEGIGNSTTANAANSPNPTTASLTGPWWRAWNYVSRIPLAHEWDGSTDTDWGTTDNWGGGVPTSSDDVIIPDVTNNPLISGDVTTPSECNTIRIESDGDLTIPVLKALTVSGDITNEGVLTIESTATGTGSLIAKGAYTNNGTTTVQRYITSYSAVGADDGWHFISSPVFEYAILGSVFAPVSGEDDLYEYGETVLSDNWLNYTGGTFGDADFEVGKGYLVAYKTAATKSFSGTINTGAVVKSLTYTTGSPGQGWNLLGNPYTSAIDWDDLTKTASVDGSVYAIESSDGSYASYNGSTGDITNGILAAHQGFFVKATAASQTVTMETVDQKHSSNNIFKSGQTTEGTFIVSVGYNDYINNTYIQIRDDATTIFDNAIDAYKLFGFSQQPQLFTNDGNTVYSINCLPPNMDSYLLPLDTKIQETGEYQLTFTDIENLSNLYNIELEDLLTSTTVDVTSELVYTFAFTEGDTESRFILHFKSTTGLDENQTSPQNTVSIYSNNNNIVVNALKGNTLSGELFVSNIVGQVVYQQELNNANQQVVNTNLNTGIYIVSLKLDSGYVISKKVIIK